MTTTQFPAGTLIRARGREWMVLSSLKPETLRVRPLSGSEADQTLIHIPLEAEPVTAAQFPPPHPAQNAGHEAALLLRDALVLSLRRGAGPFRSFGQIAVEPRAYQLVPLLMALKLDVVRLLIADDVGIGKTIEAGLIARELLDRGDVERITVLCPPHLVEQWVVELQERFHIRAVPVTASSAVRLERGLPIGESVFTAHPYTVVSLDYIKSEKRRGEFLRACPEFVIVDEAHTCTMGLKGRHQRYELLKGLSEQQDRHIVLLTATPHSGDEQAFYRLLGLLDKDFETLSVAQGSVREEIRKKLTRHFVQRRRPDIKEWSEGELFPKRETIELTYKLSGQWEDFFHHVLDYCAEIIASAGSDERKQRLNFWGTLALLRCASSSPDAAIKTLRTRALGNFSEETENQLEDQVFDGDSDHLSEDDQEPCIGIEDQKIKDLINEAYALTGKTGDPKLKLLKDHLSRLIRENFNPVVFCRYIATAHYLKKHLQNEYKGVTVEVITGEFTSDERRMKVDALGEADQRLLIATDCLSEGINLQNAFDAVVHYDLSWNPTRHEQREGRVDRYGQRKSVVKASIIYGENNAIDGAVLQVILRKGESIRKELGISVPLPDDNHKLTQALMKAVLLRDRNKSNQTETQMIFDFMTVDEAQELNTIWTNAGEKAKKSRTVFAQNSLRPSDVLPELKRTLEIIGGRDDVKRFTIRALARLGAEPEQLKKFFKAPLMGLPGYVQERLEQEGLVGTPLIDFSYPPSNKCKAISRSHPLVHILADTLLEHTLANFDEGCIQMDPAVLGRVGCWVSNEVKSKTTIVLLRLRHQLTTELQKRTHTMLVEEAAAIGFEGKSILNLIEGPEVLQLLSEPPVQDVPIPLRDRNIKEALAYINQLSPLLDDFAEKRAKELLSDHRRVREAAGAKGKYSVKAQLPQDVIGIFILLPPLEG